MNFQALCGRIFPLCVFALLFHVVSNARAQVPPSPTLRNTNTVFPIDLPTVLRLANAQNLDVQMAREKLAEARADNESATLKFFPWLTAGIAYRRHDGQIQSTEGDILTVNKQSYAPGGALVSQLDLGDAIYNKLAARQLEHASEHALDAQRQDTVATAAQGYFDLAFVHASVGVSEEAVRISTNYEAQVRHAVESGIASGYQSLD